jgi:hypothetical protein
MSSSDEALYYLFVAGAVVASTYIGLTWGTNNSNDYAAIKHYMLNESNLHGYDKPKIWIHSKFEYNARKWQSFHSRSSYDLNQPYIHLTIRSIIEHCGDDFHICLIDDDTFSKLLENWDIDLKTVAEPMRTRYREIGMMELVYQFGGMVLPNSLVCLKSFKDVYYTATEGSRPFVCEAVNRTTDMIHQKGNNMFIPSTYIMGAQKHNGVIAEYIKHLKHINQNLHFSSDHEFVGQSSQWCIDRIRGGDMNLVGGETVGVKTSTGKAVVLDNLMEEEYLALSPYLTGIYIPEEELLSRTKYQWFAVMPIANILQTSTILSKYIKMAMVDGFEKAEKTEHQSHSAI